MRAAASTDWPVGGACLQARKAPFAVTRLSAWGVGHCGARASAGQEEAQRAGHSVSVVLGEKRRTE